MRATEEADLIAEARGGSTAAFEQLYRMHSGRVYGLCLRLSESQSDAQDATQETFIKAWRALGRFRGDSAFTTWLHRIAFNAAVSLRRRRSTEQRHLQLVDPAEPIAESSYTDVERLERAVAALPDRAREALVLHKIYGYTYEETAEFMSIAVGTCKAQVHRAVQRLRRMVPLAEEDVSAAIEGSAMREARDRD